MNKKKELKIGTRGSKLALIQTKQVIEALQKKHPDFTIETVVLHTKGDKILDKPLIDFGGKGVFVTEFEEAIRDGRIDFAVHSSKDMPMELGENLILSGVLPRADARDVLVSRKGEIPIRIGTGSLRRKLQVERLYPEIHCESIRGNVTTRLQKVREGEYDGVILAAAGLERLNLLEEADLAYRYFSYDEMVPAGGQGIIAIEGKKDGEFQEWIDEISDQKALQELETEREILMGLNAGCHEAIGVFSEALENYMRIRIIRENHGKILQKDHMTTLENRLSMARQLVAEIKAGE